MTIPTYIQQEQQQVSREQLARSRQAIAEMEHHYNNYEAQMRMMQSNIRTEEDALKYASLMLELNRCRDNLKRHIDSYNELVRIANVQFSTTRISDQVKREIYHFYHSKRYTQMQLAQQYGVDQSTVSKIVNGQPPA